MSESEVDNSGLDQLRANLNISRGSKQYVRENGKVSELECRVLRTLYVRRRQDNQLVSEIGERMGYGKTTVKRHARAECSHWNPEP